LVQTLQSLNSRAVKQDCGSGGSGFETHQPPHSSKALKIWLAI
jgi:hypothetical protein